jgi:hypothetical protein
MGAGRIAGFFTLAETGVFTSLLLALIQWFFG